MNKFVSSIIIVFIFIPTLQAWGSDESSAIKQTALNYMESWYQGDAKRMKDSLHKKLAKRSLLYGNHDKAELRDTKASHMISYTGSGGGQDRWSNDFKIDVIILDYYKNIASVKVLAPHYYEYLHLVKIDKKWVIVNALYENKSPVKN